MIKEPPTGLNDDGGAVTRKVNEVKCNERKETGRERDRQNEVVVLYVKCEAEGIMGKI